MVRHGQTDQSGTPMLEGAGDLNPSDRLEPPRRLPSLRTWLMAIILIVVLTNLVVITAALLHSGRSFREVSENRLQETAKIVAQSTASEIIATERLLVNYINPRIPGVSPAYSLQSAAIAGLDYMVYRIPESMPRERLVADGVPIGVIDLAERAFATGEEQISGILEGQVPSVRHSIIVAVPVAGPGGTRLVAAVIASPKAMLQSLYRTDSDDETVILAITDNQGRIVGRSVDGDEFVGRSVPDWGKLKALERSSGSFRAKTVDGRGVIFAFQEIPGTNGWMAVAGEPETTFDARWQEPIITMVVVSTLTLLGGLAMALLMLRRVSVPIAGLVQRARRVAEGIGHQGSALVIPPSGIAEVETLRLSLNAAEDEMNKRLSESRAAEEVASRNLAGLEQAERLARLGSWTYDIDADRFRLSSTLRQLAELDPQGDDLSLKDLTQFFDAQSYDRLVDVLQECVLYGTPYSFEARALLPSGRSFMAWIRGNAILDPDGKVIAVTGTLQDIDERTEQNARLAALADNLPRGMIMRIERDELRHLRITYLSRGAEQLTGRNASEIMAHPEYLARMLQPEDLAQIMKVLRFSDESGELLDHHFLLRRDDGSEIWLRMRAGLRIPDSGRAIWDGIVLDISAERLATEALEEAKTAAEAAERAKTDFLATMSHEIRTPMNSVIGMARLALRTDLSPKQRRYLERIDDSANVLLGIINDILDFSKIEAGALPLEAAPFRLEAVLETVASMNSIRAEEKGIELTFDVALGVPEYLKGDSLRLGQVLTNLVSNAIKFTQSGDVVVSIRPANPPKDAGPHDLPHDLLHDEPFAPSDGPLRLVCSVRDTGMGIEPEQLSALFKPFSQAETGTARKYGGTGLGLAISRQIVALMHGEISVKSTPGIGSTFTFTAEFGAVDAAELPQSEQLSQRVQLNARRVLVVDDNGPARFALCDMVAGFGAHVQAAESGAEALILLRGSEAAGQPYDIVVLDWRMPGMDGIELARHIRSDLRLRHMPAILMVTAYGHELALTEMSGVSFRDVLIKPVTQSVVYNSLIGALCDAPRNAVPVLGLPESDLSHITARLAGREILVVDDNALNREVASELLALVGIKVVEAVNGREAIDKMNDQSFDAVLMDVHMPVMSGLEAIREIRERPEWRDLPVIALTAQARVEDVDASHAAGMSGHLTKPIHEMTLFRCLLEHIDREAAPAAPHAAPHLLRAQTAVQIPAEPSVEPPREGGREGGRDAAASPANPAAAPAAATASAAAMFDAAEPSNSLETYLQFFGGSHQRLRRFVDGFLRDFGEMDHEYAALMVEEDWGAVADYAHRLRGVVGYLGLDPLYRLSGQVEVDARSGAFDDVQASFKTMLDLMQSCLTSLTELQQTLAEIDVPATGRGLAAGPALALAHRALPLVQAGDFSANAALDQLADGLQDPALKAMAIELRERFADLEVEAAYALLTALANRLQAGAEVGP